MKAVVYDGPRQVSVTDVPDARIERPTDVLYGAGPVGNMGLGADNGCECVGYQAHDPQGNEHPNMTLNRLVKSVRFTGDTGVVGVYVTQDPNSPDPLFKQGEVAFDLGEFWFRGQKMGTGQCPVKRYNRQLRDLIGGGKAQPSWLVSHELPLDQALGGYEHSDKRDEGWTKVVLHPNSATTGA